MFKRLQTSAAGPKFVFQVGSKCIQATLLKAHCMQPVACAYNLDEMQLRSIHAVVSRELYRKYYVQALSLFGLWALGASRESGKQSAKRRRKASQGGKKRRSNVFYFVFRRRYRLLFVRSH